MAVRLRRTNGRWSAYCAAKTKPLDGDVYIDDTQDIALRRKYIADYMSEGIIRREDYFGMCDCCNDRYGLFYWNREYLLCYHCFTNFKTLPPDVDDIEWAEKELGRLCVGKT